MSTKKLNRTPKGNNGKLKVKPGTKTIKSFFRPISNRSLYGSSGGNPISQSKELPRTHHDDEIISPSPQKAKAESKIEESSPISPINPIQTLRKSPRLKLKKKNIQKMLAEDAIIAISSDSDDGREALTAHLGKEDSGNDKKNEDEISVYTSDSDVCTSSAHIQLSSPLVSNLREDDNLIPDSSLADQHNCRTKKLKFKKRHIKNLSNDFCGNTETFQDGDKNGNMDLESRKRKASDSEDARKNKRLEVHNPTGIEVMKCEDDISDINFDDTFEGVDLDSAVPISGCVDSSATCNIELDDSLLDIDLDDADNCIEPDISDFQMWKVVQITASDIHLSDSISEKVLYLNSDDKSTDGTCSLRGDWYFMDIDVGDKVYVSALSRSSNSCILDNVSKHYLVVFPNTLISGTTIAAGITCERKAVLNERFKMDLQTNKAVFLGSITHDLFDWVLQQKGCCIDDIEKRALENLKNPKYIEQLSILNLDVAGIVDMQKEYYSSLQTWSKQFMGDSSGMEIDFKTGQEKGDEFVTNVHVDRIVDIEENIWSPYYGLKGKVDATVEVVVHRKPKLNNAVSKKRYLLPLEFKTGKLLSTLGSIDHRAQVAVYTLLMSEKYKLPIDTGLLLYGKSNHMIGVPRPEQEKRAILIKRNEIARHLSLEKRQLALPPLLKKKRICSRCDQKGTCMLYFKSMESGDALGSGVEELFSDLTSHLSEDDLQYFAKWYTLCILEASVGDKGLSDRYIWQKTSEQRENNGICFSGMVCVSYEFSHLDSKHFYKFKRKENHFNCCYSLKSIPLGTSERVIISEEHAKVFNLTTGYITDVSADTITISVYREVRSIAQNNGKAYRIDKDDTLSNYSTSLNNLAHLFKVNSDSDAKLRDLIIKAKEPQFSDEIVYKNDISLKNIDTLNSVQKTAVQKCLAAKDYVIIHGMPGAGKSTTIASIVQALVTEGKSVLLTSYTHSAVDTILVKLLKVGFSDFVRLGQASRVHANIFPYTYEERTKSFTDVGQYKDFYKELKVVATTCLGINHPIFLTRHFDYCIVDEASQITQPVCIGPIRNADVFILVGDHNQLPPLVTNSEAKEKGLDCSLFQSLSNLHQNAVVTLNYQYRMNGSIMSLMNTLVYENRMKCANDFVANSLLNLPKYNELSKQNRSHQLWDIVNPGNPVVFVNTDKVQMMEEKTGSFIVNRGEANLVKELIKIMIQCGFSSRDIGVISMYRHQVKIIKDELDDKCIEVDTMDKYQGKDKECIIISFVRSNNSSEVGELLKDWRRINVAMTRAKTKLIMIGSRTTIVNSEILSKLISLIDERSWCVEMVKMS